MNGVVASDQSAAAGSTDHAARRPAAAAEVPGRRGGTSGGESARAWAAAWAEGGGGIDASIGSVAVGTHARTAHIISTAPAPPAPLASNCCKSTTTRRTRPLNYCQ